MAAPTVSRRSRRRRGVLPGWVLMFTAVAFLLLGVCVIVLPVLLVPAAPSTSRDLGAVDHARFENERLVLRNSVRTTLLQAFGGAFFVVTAFLTWRQIEISREGQLTERFGRAIDHLGEEDKLEVRLGGIYALERIAGSSRDERGPIVEILTAYVRGHASRPASQQSSSSLQGVQDKDGWAKLAPLRARAPDVQAVLTVLGRRLVEDLQVLELPAVDLRKVALPEARLRLANLEGADLSGANLQRADLRESMLQAVELRGAHLGEADLGAATLLEADLRGADLVRAKLEKADLRRANLHGANLRGSALDCADLMNANLGEAVLERATLQEARLEEANLWKAALDKADLRNANLERSVLVQATLDGATLDGATLVGATLRGVTLAGASLTAVDLTGAKADAQTVWPDGFDWSRSGATVESR